MTMSRPPYVVALAMLFAVSCSNDPSDSTSAEAPALEPAATVRAPGSVTGRAPAAIGGYNSIVILEPDEPMELPRPADPPRMDQAGMAFYPKILIGRVGQPVQFKNSEDVLHNVRVFDGTTRRAAFNVATPIDGIYEHVFDKEGIYPVSCDVHPAMAATVLVVSTPFATVTDREGAFAFSDVPPGTYTLRIRNDGRWMEREVEVGSESTEIIVDTMPPPAE